MGKITDSWSTPQHVFDAIAAKHGPFDLDAAAAEGNAKCEKFFTEADNSLNQNWSAVAKYFVPRGSNINYQKLSNGGYIVSGDTAIHKLGPTVWLNCPYSDVTPWLIKARAEVAKGCKVVMLLNYDHSTAWWQSYIEDPSRNFEPYPGVTVEKLTKRIKFVPPPGCLGKDGKAVKRTTNTRPSVVVIFEKVKQ